MADSKQKNAADTPATGNARKGKMTRRQALGLGGVFALGWGLAGAGWWWRRHERGLKADVFIGKAESYRADLVALVASGLAEIGVTRAWIKGKRVLLKPNLVETALSQTHINTHPALVTAAAEVFRRMDAAEVFVAEGQGHRRDSWLVLDESGMGQALAEARLMFFDLNHDDVEAKPNEGDWTDLQKLYLPKRVLAADLVVSMPKMKTHHWAGVTCSMKNMFGVMPGVVYGWPKNVLHWSGIPNSILDINATVKPGLAIVDGIVGMEGDGPIMGDPKQVGLIVMGRNLPAVDATCVRLMGLNVRGIPYLAEASGRLGPVLEWNIRQRGEAIAGLKTQFEVLDVPHLAGVREA